jgi:phospholipid-binding lipoprotein MlaA
MRTYFLLAIGVLAVGGCASSHRSKPQASTTVPADVNSPMDANSPSDAALDELEADLAQKQVTIADPLEPVNRFLFGFNDVAYFWVVKPVSQAYSFVVPKPARTGIGNFFSNIGTPARLINCILQGKNAAADVELARFGINTTIGILGFGDPARDRWKLEPKEEDLGQTLAVYGLGGGFYLVLPLMGPSTLRDTAGMVGDEFLNPIRYIPPEELSIGLSVESAVNRASLHAGEYETFKSASLDPYVALRNAYIQYRQKQIRGEDRPADPNSAKPQAPGDKSKTSPRT